MSQHSNVWVWHREVTRWSDATPICAPGGKRWMEARERGITASEIAIAAGLSEWEQPLSLWTRKREAYLRNKNRSAFDTVTVVPEDVPLHIELGNILEPLIKAEFEKRYGKLLVKKPWLFRMKGRSHCLCTPDAVVTDFVLLECKTVAKWTANQWGEDGTEKIPLPYMCQVQYQMAVMGAKECWVVAFMRHSDEFRFYSIPRSQPIIDRLIALADEFWHKVTHGLAPEIDWTHHTTANLISSFNSNLIVKKAMSLAPGWDDEWNEYLKLGEVERLIKKRREFLKARVTHAIGDAEAGVLPDGRIVKRNKIVKDAYQVKASSYVTLTTSKPDSVPVNVEGTVPYVAVIETKQPARIELGEADAKRIGFDGGQERPAEPGEVGSVQEPVRDGAAEAPVG
jgi:putative phage-type endonuclease